MKKTAWCASLLGTCLLLAASPGWTKSKKSPPAEPASSDVQSEIDAISGRLKDSSRVPQNPAPQETRSVGIFKYPVNPTGFQRLLPDISLIGTFAGAYFSQEPAGETGVDPSRTGFNLQEIELAFQSVIDPYFRADVMLAFGEEGVELEEGYFTTLGLVKGLQIRGGKMRLPFGRQNQKHTENWDFVDNTLVNKAFLGPDGLKELGIEISYLIPVPFFLQLQGTFSNGDGDTSFGGTRVKDFLYQGRVTMSFDPSVNTSLLFGGSAAFGFNASGLGNQTMIYGGDFLFKWKPKSYRSVVWQSEYLFRQFDDAAGNQNDGGLYSYIDWQFLKRWHAGIRYDQMGLPEAIVPKEYRLSPAITFNPTEFTRIRAQYEYDKVANLDSVHAAFLQFEFSMGPHGAHPF
ncbi:MAG TPA: hypothetical protein VFX30_07005 [bacterium]|nr:hypothetical protein [bacterium]